MFGQFAPLAGAVCVPLPPAAGAEAAGAGLAALTTATPPTAIIPTDRSVVAMTRRAPENLRRAAGTTGCSTGN
jgi:hypothetical protein